ncbi:hypothetical protein Q3G72_024463 [Acer saccharum]|nr:hypothetical protein Q3G72_024463 [Acer saccharum]
MVNHGKQNQVFCGRSAVELERDIETAALGQLCLPKGVMAVSVTVCEAGNLTTAENIVQNSQLSGGLSPSSDRTTLSSIYIWKAPEVYFPVVFTDCDSGLSRGSYGRFRNGA